MAMKIPLTSECMIFVICLPSPPKNHFTFNNKYYKQVHSVAMGSPVGPALTKVFMCGFEMILTLCYTDVKLMTCLHCFLHLIMKKSLKGICHLKISTQILLQRKRKMTVYFYLDLNILRKNKKSATNFYRKQTFSGVYTNIKRCIPKTYRVALLLNQ